MRVVICQPMLFPWVGTFEKIRLSDIYVHYDDVLFSKGSFINRVQIKTPASRTWLTVRLRGLHMNQRILEVHIDTQQAWKRRHLNLLALHYRWAPFKDDMLNIVAALYDRDVAHIAELSIASIEAVCAYYAIIPPGGFVRSSHLKTLGSKSERLVSIVQALSGTVYLCGAGNQRVEQRYLDHELLEAHGIQVEYIKYQKLAYPQLYGEFTPYVSILDLIANRGPAGRDVLVSQSIHWKILFDQQT